MRDSVSDGLDATNQIMGNVISTFAVDGDLNQMKIAIHPIIANSLYRRENEVLEQERLRTIQYLARVFSDEEMDIAMRGLRFKITIK